LNARAISTASSPVTPPGIQSVADSRTDIGFPAGQCSRQASNTSSGKRSRFSSRPPYSSTRRFVTGEMKLASRYPCAMCSSSMSNSHSTPIFTATTYWSRTRIMSLRDMVRGSCETPS
jgi:hypothetical protein